MTHDELLALIEKHYVYGQEMSYSQRMADSLTAVVKAIKDYREDTSVIANAEFDQGARALCHLVIQAIEKELG